MRKNLPTTTKNKIKSNPFFCLYGVNVSWAHNFERMKSFSRNNVKFKRKRYVYVTNGNAHLL